jgi:hypothetical protein
MPLEAFQKQAMILIANNKIAKAIDFIKMFKNTSNILMIESKFINLKRNGLLNLILMSEMIKAEHEITLQLLEIISQTVNKPVNVHADKRTVDTKKELLNLVEKNQLKKALNLMQKLKEMPYNDFQIPLIAILARFNRNQNYMALGILSLFQHDIEVYEVKKELKNLINSTCNESNNPSLDSKSTDSLLKVLVIANATTETHLLEKEVTHLNQILGAEPMPFSIKRIRNAEIVTFIEVLDEYKPNILHFLGNGSSDIFFTYYIGSDKSTSYKHILRSDEFVLLLEYCQTIPIPIKAIILNGCYSEFKQGALRIAKWVPYLIGTEINTELAAEFSANFYSELTEKHLDFELAFKKGRSQAIMAGANRGQFTLFKDGVIVKS